jgi:kumamolisin
MKHILRIFFASNVIFAGIPILAQPMTAILTLSERTPINELAQNVLNPNSDRYQDYYSPEEIRDLVAPSDADYAKLLKTLRSEGFSIINESKAHLSLTVKAEHSVFEKVFKTQIHFLSEKFHTQTMKAQIPSRLSLVASVSGLDNTTVFKPQHKKVKTLETFADQPGILPSTIKTVYGLNGLYSSGLSGKDQHIAIATYMNYSMEDVNHYYELIGLPTIPILDTITFNGTAPYDADSAIETQLDAELAGMIAPGAYIHVFASAENNYNGEMATFTAILDDNRSKVVNYSWGTCETNETEIHRKDMDKIFARAVAQGVNILAASGDSGSDSCDDGGKVALWPALHPYLVAVGGTTLNIGRNNTAKETGWSGSGGGVSLYYPLPSWQSNFKAPFTKRSFPDIAFNADPGTGEGVWVRETATSSPAWMQVGGTSMAAPQWVGFLALVNEGRNAQGAKALGFINPILYPASKTIKGKIFTDITVGKNGAYTATTGWDAVTGWGSLKGAEMYNYLLSR